MAELVWALPCNKVLVDASDVMTIIDVVERVTLLADREQFEEAFTRDREAGRRVLIEHPWTFVSFWIRSRADQPEKQRVRVRVVPADGGRELTILFELDLTESEKVRTLIPVPGFPWGGEGTSWIHIDRASGDSEEWRTCAKVPVELVIQEAPTRGERVFPKPEPKKAKRSKGAAGKQK